MKSKSSRASFSFIGGGRAGASLALYFKRHRFHVLSIIDNNPQRFLFLKNELKWPNVFSSIETNMLEKSDFVIITVSDDHISEIARDMANLDVRWSGKVVAHTSGIHSSKSLVGLKNCGAFTASIHPIYSFPLNPLDDEYMDKMWFDIEGDDEALIQFENIFRLIKNKSIRIGEDQKTAIHLASVFYANFFVSLAHSSHLIMSGVLPHHQHALRLLDPLLKSSLDQVLKSNPASALTGPLKRGDIGTIRRHLDFLKKNFPEMLQSYIELTHRLISICNLPESIIKTIHEHLDRYKIDN